MNTNIGSINAEVDETREDTIQNLMPYLASEEKKPSKLMA